MIEYGKNNKFFGLFCFGAICLNEFLFPFVFFTVEWKCLTKKGEKKRWRRLQRRKGNKKIWIGNSEKCSHTVWKLLQRVCFFSFLRSFFFNNGQRIIRTEQRTASNFRCDFSFFCFWYSSMFLRCANTAKK